MKTLAVLMVTFGMFAHATNNAACPHQNKMKREADTNPPAKQSLKPLAKPAQQASKPVGAQD